MSGGRGLRPTLPTTHHSKESHFMKNKASRRHSAHDVQSLDEEFTNLLIKAAHGDRRAIGAIAIAHGPGLLTEARKALGPERASEDEDVLQDLLVSMTHGTLEFVPDRDEPLEWLRARIRLLASTSATDLLVARAADRDPHAVAELFTLLSDMLLEEARWVLGEAFAHGAEDVVQDLGEALLEGLVSFERGRRGGIGFLRCVVRSMARIWHQQAEDRTALDVDAGEKGGE
jgi:DNA-directed RNA polymerase specialized sigma24 family protein